MLYKREAQGQVQDVVKRLEQAIKEHQFGILGQIDLRAKMVDKGVPFEHECVIVEVCNPKQAKKVLDQNMDVSTSLPCRMSIYEHDGKAVIATVKPTVLLEMYEGAESLAAVAKEVEDTIVAIIDEASAGERKEP